jgi:2-polyprenyl-3-methyl-5-hydroxy-6-metoxy-1,4-benzoquinol methylase
MGNGCTFAAAGLLRRDELQAASAEQYRDFCLSTAEVDAGLTAAEACFYRRFLRAGDRILLVGCGSGRDLLALSAMGYEVTGLDAVADLVELARRHLRRRGMSAGVAVGLIQTIELCGYYDAVIFSNGCYSLLQGSKVRVATLTRLAPHLSADGRVIVSYYPVHRRSRIGHWLACATAGTASVDWRPEAGDVFSRDLRQPALIRYHHAFEPSDVKQECEAAGFRVLADERYEEGYHFAAAVPQSASP